MPPEAGEASGLFAGDLVGAVGLDARADEVARFVVVPILVAEPDAFYHFVRGLARLQLRANFVRRGDQCLGVGDLSAHVVADVFEELRIVRICLRGRGEGRGAHQDRRDR